MSTVLQESPLSTRPYSVQRPIVYRVSNALFTQPKFRFLCKVTVDGAVRAELALLPNAANQAIFDIQRIARTYLYPASRYNGESIHVYRGVSTHPDTFTPIRQVKVELGWQAAASATSAPVKTYDTTRYVQAALFAGDNADTGRSTTCSFQGVSITDYPPSGTSAIGWLTEMARGGTANLGGSRRTFTVTSGSWGVAQFFYGDATNRDLNAAPTILRTSWRTSSGWIQQDISLTLTAAASITTDFQMMGTVPAAPKNWTENSASSNLKTALIAGTVLEYELQLRTSSIPVSDVLHFVLGSSDCVNGAPIRLAWSNRLGGIDYFNFNKKRVHTMTTEKATFYQDAGTWQQNTTFLAWSGDQGGDTAYMTTTRRSLEVTTDWMTETEARYLEGLFAAERVWWVEPDASLEIPSVQLAEKDYVRKTFINDGLVRYTVTLQMAKTRETR